MSETKWAAGPWAYDPTINRVYSVPNNMLVATVWLGGLTDTPSADPEWPANARLIAAAPEMYEALETVAQLLRDHHADQGAEDGWQNEELRDAWVAARDVLAKAEGRS